MPLLHITEVYNFYQRFIFQPERFELLRRYGLPVAGSVPFVDWELFGAMLTGEQSQGRAGADLDTHEVKSASSINTTCTAAWRSLRRISAWHTFLSATHGITAAWS